MVVLIAKHVCRMSDVLSSIPLAVYIVQYL